MNKELTIKDKKYAQWVKELCTRYRQSNMKATGKTNREMLKYYWELGRDIVELHAELQWGMKFLSILSRDLKKAIPEATCFSKTNLLYIKNFYLIYKPYTKTAPQSGEQGQANPPQHGKQAQTTAPQAGEQLITTAPQVGEQFRATTPRAGEQFLQLLFSIPWGQHKLLIDKFKLQPEMAAFYACQTVRNEWSRTMLLDAIHGHWHEREGDTPTSLGQVLPDGWDRRPAEWTGNLERFVPAKTTNADKPNEPVPSHDPKITMVRTEEGHAAPKVSACRLQQLLEKMKENVGNPILEMLRTNIRIGLPYIQGNYKGLHRIYPSARLKKTEGGQLKPVGYNDVLLLSTGPIFEAEKLERIKQQAKVLPTTLAAFTGSGGRSVKILVRTTLPEAERHGNETEMEAFFRHAYEVASALYATLLQVPVAPAGIHDGSSPVMASCRMTADRAPLWVNGAVPLRMDDYEPMATVFAPRAPESTAPADKNPNKITAMVDYLAGRYGFRYNKIRNSTEYFDKQTPHWGWRMADQRFINALSINVREAGIEATLKEVTTYVNSSHIRVTDPVADYLTEVEGRWDGHDYIGDLAACVQTDLPQWKSWFRLWFLGMVAQWMGYNRQYGNSLVPLLVSPQGWRKSTFCSQLLPPELRWGYTDSLRLENSRQVMQSMCECLLINIDEFNSISKKVQEGFLKNTIQLATIPLKRPYARTVVQERRMASFIATSNLTDILSDPSGSRRFFVVNLTKPVRMTGHIPYAQLYAQAVAAVKQDERRWFDEEDILQVMAHNRRYALLGNADIYFNDYFVPAGADDPDGEWMSAADIYDHIRRRAGSTAVTENLSAFSRYLSNVPGLEKMHSRNANLYRVKTAGKGTGQS